jgi:hypothetical protein
MSNLVISDLSVEIEELNEEELNELLLDSLFIV